MTHVNVPCDCPSAERGQPDSCETGILSELIDMLGDAQELKGCTACRVDLLSRLLASEGKRAGSFRVITGKGNHSSGGEASLGRVVANHLAGQSIAHTVQGGAISVHIRAQDQGQRRH